MGFDLRKTMSDFFTGIANGLLDWNFQVDDGANEKPKRAKGYTEEHTQEWLDSVKKPKRARGKKGRYLADDPTTKGVNEAWVGGKAPKKKRKY